MKCLLLTKIGCKNSSIYLFIKYIYSNIIYNFWKLKNKQKKNSPTHLSAIIEKEMKINLYKHRKIWIGTTCLEHVRFHLFVTYYQGLIQLFNLLLITIFFSRLVYYYYFFTESLVCDIHSYLIFHVARFFINPS